MGENMYKKLLFQLCHISKRINLNFVFYFSVSNLSPSFDVSHSWKHGYMYRYLCRVVILQHPCPGRCCGCSLSLPPTLETISQLDKYLKDCIASMTMKGNSWTSKEICYTLVGNV